MPSGNAGDRRSPGVQTSASSGHLAPDISDLPASMSGATQQVRSGVLNVLSGDHNIGASPSSPSQMMQDRPLVPGQVLRTIDLTLSPADLGTVRIRLSLKSNALDIDAEASKASTAKLLDDDRKGLEQSLRNAGYDVTSLKISDVSAAASSNLNNSLNGGGSSFQDSSQARASLAGRQDGNAQGRNGAMPDQSQQRSRDNNQKNSPAPEIANRRQGNAIYI
jgi:flagellar hook-length control protein FliK